MGRGGSKPRGKLARVTAFPALFACLSFPHRAPLQPGPQPPSPPPSLAGDLLTPGPLSELQGCHLPCCELLARGPRAPAQPVGERESTHWCSQHPAPRLGRSRERLEPPGAGSVPAASVPATPRPPRALRMLLESRQADHPHCVPPWAPRPHASPPSPRRWRYLPVSWRDAARGLSTTSLARCRQPRQAPAVKH